MSLSSNQRCNLANIKKIGVKTRKVIGGVLLAASFLATLLMLGSSLDRFWRVILFAPFFGSFLCLIQARQNVCVVMAVKESQETENGIKKINNKILAQELKAVGNKILGYSFALALMITTGIVFL